MTRYKSEGISAGQSIKKRIDIIVMSIYIPYRDSLLIDDMMNKASIIDDFYVQSW